MTLAGLISVLGVGVSVGALSRVLSRQARPSTRLAVAVGILAALLGTVVARRLGVDISGFSHQNTAHGGNGHDARDGARR